MSKKPLYSGTYKIIGNPKDRTRPCAVIAFLLKENCLAIAASGYNPDSSKEFDPNFGKKVSMNRAIATMDRFDKGLESTKSFATAFELDGEPLGNIISKTTVVQKGKFLSLELAQSL